MQTVETIYRESVRQLPDAEKLELAARILHDLSKTKSNSQKSAVEMLDSMPAARLFKNSDEIDEYLRRDRESWDG